MKLSILRVLLVGIAVSMFVVAARADSIADPTIIIRDPACPSTCMSVGTSFTFGTPSSGIGTLFFNNGSGVNWFNLSLTESGVAANLITCVTDAFANCTVTTVNNVTTIFLSGVGSGFAGIGAGQNFSIVFGCTSGTCDPWPGDLDFTAHANVPEPATMALLATGIGVLVTRRKLGKKIRA